MANMLSISMTFTRQEIVAPMYEFATTINLDPVVAPVGSSVTQNGSVTVPPHPPTEPLWTYVAAVSFGEGGVINARLQLNGAEVLSESFPRFEQIRVSREVASSDGQMQVTLQAFEDL